MRGTKPRIAHPSPSEESTGKDEKTPPDDKRDKSNVRHEHHIRQRSIES